MNLAMESELFQVLSKKLGQEETKLLIKYVNQVVKDSSDKQVTQKDLYETKIEIIEKVQNAKISTLVTVVLLIIGQLGVLLGIIQIFLK